MTTPQWVQELFATIDAKDADGFTAYFTENGTLIFGNAPPANGKEAIREVVAGFFNSISALDHTIDGNWFHPDCVFCRGTVTYTRLDGSQVTLPFADILDMDGTKVTKYQIYMDINPLFQPAETAEESAMQ